MADIEVRLRELAEKATKGPWRPGEAASGWVLSVDEPYAAVIRDSLAEVQGVAIARQDNADFIAACDPQTIIALLDSLSSLRTERDRLAANRRFIPQQDTLVGQLATAEREREEWKQKYEEGLHRAERDGVSGASVRPDGSEDVR